MVPDCTLVAIFMTISEKERERDREREKENTANGAKREKSKQYEAT